MSGQKDLEDMYGDLGEGDRAPQDDGYADDFAERLEVGSDEREPPELYVDRLMKENYAALRKRNSDAIDNLLFMIKEADIIIRGCDRMLMRWQPPSSGRIRVVWRKKKKRNELYDLNHPYLVKWKQKKTRWYFVELGPRPYQSISSKGGFAGCYFEVKEVISILLEVIKRRRNFVETLNVMTRSTSRSWDAWGAKRDAQFESLRKIVSRVGEKEHTWGMGESDELLDYMSNRVDGVINDLEDYS